MGPSGSGKTTLLNLLARRHVQSASHIGSVLVDDHTLSNRDFQSISSFVEQEDALIGSLTVRETIDFSLRLSPVSSRMTANQRSARVETLLGAFGLKKQAETLIGTPIRKGVSGGEKRRTSVAAQLITDPSILFLDEPTSGLDSAASYSVIHHLRHYARSHSTLVIASIHQPSTSTFQLFDKLLLLSQGRACYFGPLSLVRDYFTGINLAIPPHTNPAEHLLDLVNVEFTTGEDMRSDVQQRLDRIHGEWATKMHFEKGHGAQVSPSPANAPETRHSGFRFISTTTTLLHRMALKSYRDLIAYGIRLAMYVGLAIMMGTVWLRLSANQESIQPFINAIFFGSAFMSFMAVAYVPAFLEDRATLVKDRMNGLYGPASFLIANFVVGVPYLFLFSVIFSVIAYWLTGFNAEAISFFRWIMWVFLDLLAAESLVVFISALLPNFVLALAATAFANGLWMACGGFLISPRILNVFWRYVFHYIDYQAYVFQGMMVNEFESRIYDCGTGCSCMYDSLLASQCKIDGRAVLETYGYARHRTGKWVGLLLAIIAVYRVLGYLALRFIRS